LRKELKVRRVEAKLFDALKTLKELPWVKIGIQIAKAVQNREYGEGSVLCWTRIGISIAANKPKKFTLRLLKRI